MKEPKITFKNVKTFQGMEGVGINADVYINGVKCYFIIDSGDGGDLEFRDIIQGNITNIQFNKMLLDEYIKSLPEKKWNIGGTEKFFKVTLEDYINDKIVEWDEQRQKKKFQNKMKKLFKTCIVFGVPDSGSYQYLNFKKPLDSFPPEYLDMQIHNVQKKYCKGDVQILNTNLQQLVAN
ncbi:MAG: hypothetical protein M0R03_16420 [Novosphingobium sp.]|nr:hypothetical protein [Novosphingobium sp.]